MTTQAGYMTPEEELAVIDQKMRLKSISTAMFLKLQTRRDGILKRLAKEQGLPTTKPAPAPQTNEERFLDKLKDPFEREVWEHVFRLEAEARECARLNPPAPPKAVIPDLPSFKREAPRPPAPPVVRPRPQIVADF